MSGKARILVVDDDDSIREFVRMALTDDGYDVQTAVDGLDALNAEGPFRPDLVVLDVRMAGMDGVAFARAYREKPDHAPILVFTAARDAAASAAKVEADAFLAKPFDLHELLSLVARLTGTLPGP